MANAPDSIHPVAADGYNKAITADNYVKGRPGYPAEIKDWLKGTLGLRAGMCVVDLGAGTGKFTPFLIETGASVIAVEPVDALRDKLSHLFPNVETLAGKAESVALPDDSVDAVVCAQAFHWFANAQALQEIYRVLKPGGKLGLVWNHRDSRIGWVAQLNEIVNQFEGDAPRYHSGKWREAFPFKGFGPLHEAHFSLGHTGTPKDVIFNRVRSTSFIAALPAETRNAMEAQIQALIASEPELRGQTTVTVPYETTAIYTAKV